MFLCYMTQPCPCCCTGALCPALVVGLPRVGPALSWELWMQQGTQVGKVCILSHPYPCLVDVSLSSWARWSTYLRALLKLCDLMHIENKKKITFLFLKPWEVIFLLFWKEKYNQKNMCIWLYKIQIIQKDKKRENCSFISSSPMYFNKKNVWLVVWPQTNPLTSPNRSFLLCYELIAELNSCFYYFFSVG